MYFSTERSVMTSEAAMAAFVLPCAISARMSRSRGVNAASGDRSHPAPLRSDERVHDLRVDDRATSRYFANRADELVEVVDALFQQVAAAC